MEEIILGIDPGTLVTGYGIIHARQNNCLLDFGVITPPKKSSLEMRYLFLFEALETLITRFSPHAIVTETQYVSKNVQSAIKLGMARGMVLLAAAKNCIPYFDYTPSEAKKAVVGHGSASKHQVQQMVRILLGLSSLPEPEDASDALALALAHIHTLKMRKQCMTISKGRL